MNDKEIVKLVENLGIELGKQREANDSHYGGGPYYADNIWIITGATRDITGVMVTWMSERVSLAYYDYDLCKLTEFQADHMDNIAHFNLNTDDPKYRTPMSLFAHYFRILRIDNEMLCNELVRYCSLLNEETE